MEPTNEDLIQAQADADAITQQVLDEIAKSTTHLGDKYQRNRPFLVVIPVGRPANTASMNRKERRQRGVLNTSLISQVNTSEQGWANKVGNWSMFERPSIVDRVNDKMTAEAVVIIDIINTKVVKNRHRDDRHNPVSDDAIMSHYLSRYSNEITQGLQVWTEQITKASRAG